MTVTISMITMMIVMMSIIVIIKITIIIIIVLIIIIAMTIIRFKKEEGNAFYYAEMNPFFRMSFYGFHYTRRYSFFSLCTHCINKLEQ